MLGLGLTNKEIARELDISTRTVGAHIQNILNKLGATNRAQVAAWTARQVDVRPLPPPRALAMPVRAEPPEPSRQVMHFSPALQVALLVVAGLLLTLVFPADHGVAEPSGAAAVSSQRGDLVYEARFTPDGREFSLRYVLGDPDAAAVRFVPGAVEYSVLKPEGNTGNTIFVGPMPAFYAEYEISVTPGSNVTFWFNFATDDARVRGVHLLAVDTAIEAMQLGYFTGGENPILPLGGQVPLEGLQSGRHFYISVLVQPPVYRVFLNGVRVTDVTHAAPPEHHGLGFSIFGNGTGTVRLSAIRVYSVG